jgi:hypothetical protein
MAARPKLLYVDPDPETYEGWCPACDSTKVRREEFDSGLTRGREPLIRVRYECLDCGAVEVL